MKTEKIVKSEEIAAELPRRPFEAWAEERGTAAWLAAAARAMRGWAIGREVTELEFTEALQAAGEVPIGYGLSTTKRS